MFELVGSLPYLTEADGHMEAVEDGQWHWYVGDDGPGPDSIEIELCWMGICSWCFKGVDCPHSKIAHQQEGNLKVKLKLTIHIQYTSWMTHLNINTHKHSFIFLSLHLQINNTSSEGLPSPFQACAPAALSCSSSDVWHPGWRWSAGWSVSGWWWQTTAAAPWQPEHPVEMITNS